MQLNPRWHPEMRQGGGRESAEFSEPRPGGGSGGGGRLRTKSNLPSLPPLGYFRLDGVLAGDSIRQPELGAWRPLQLAGGYGDRTAGGLHDQLTPIRDVHGPSHDRAGGVLRDDLLA